MLDSSRTANAGGAPWTVKSTSEGGSNQPHFGWHCPEPLSLARVGAFSAENDTRADTHWDRMRYHGVFAANHKLRALVVPKTPPEQRADPPTPKPPKSKRSQQSPMKAQMEGWFPRFAREQLRYDVAPATDSVLGPTPAR